MYSPYFKVYLVFFLSFYFDKWQLKIKKKYEIVLKLIEKKKPMKVIRKMNAILVFCIH